MSGIVFAGGGTGGHLFPGLAMAEAFRKRIRETEITFIGAGRDIEVRVLKEQGYPLEIISITGLTNKRGFRKLGAFFKVIQGVLGSIFLLRRLRPSLVIGLGGYSSGPVGLAAYVMGIPLILQEQNARPGLTNRMLGRFARAVLVSYEESLGYFREGLARVTGNPVRDSFLHCPDGRDPDVTHVLITGGSQGAHFINTVAPAALKLMNLKIKLCALRIRRGAKTWIPCAKPMKTSLVKSGSRHSSGTWPRPYPRRISWWDAPEPPAWPRSPRWGRGTILIPYPYASHNHQEENARVWEKRGAARVLLEPELTAETLAETLDQLAGDRDLLSEMALKAHGLSRPNAVEDAIAVCLEYLSDDETH